MSELEKILKNVVLGGIGAAATLAEKGGEIAKSFVEKGEETVRQNQDVVDDLKQKAKSACDSMRMTIDVASMTPEERAELRRQLDAMDAIDKAAATGEPCECGNSCTCDESCECDDSCACDESCECSAPEADGAATYTADSECGCSCSKEGD